MGAKSREKGFRAEIAVVNEAREHGFAQARRTASLQAGLNVAEAGDVSGIDPLHIEVKCYQRTPVGRFAREHLDRERPGFIPTLVWRDLRTPWRATLAWTDLLKLLAELRNLRREVVSLRQRVNLLDPPFGVGGL